MCYYGGIECIYAFGCLLKTVILVSDWRMRRGMSCSKSTSQQAITALGMVDPARVSTEAAIMGNLAKVSQLEQQAVLKKVGQFPRFTAMMLECQHDEQGTTPIRFK